VGAASALSLSICSVDYNSFNFHYSESIILQETSKIGISNYLIDQPIIDNISVDHEIAFHTTQMENLNPVQPNKSIRITGRVIKISRGEISKV
jgi:N12 class adenine-specific DNA methylase